MALSEVEELEMLRLRKQRAMAVQPKPAAPPAPEAPEQPSASLNGPWVTGAVEAAANMGTGMIAKPVSEVMGLAAQAKDYITGKPGDAEGFQRMLREGMTYEPRTPEGKAVAKYNPLALVGQGVDYLTNKLEAPPDAPMWQRSLGSGAHEAANQATGFVALKAPPVAAAAGRALRSGAEGMMTSALKPTIKSHLSGKAGKAVDTMLDNGYSVTAGSAFQMRKKIEDLKYQVQQMVSGSSATIDKAAVLQRLDEVYRKYEMQSATSADLAAIKNIENELKNHPVAGDQIPIAMAQKIKQGNDRKLGEKSYGNNLEPAASRDATKAVTRGLKEEIQTELPGVSPLNAEMSQLLNALSVSERRVFMDANKNPMGLAALAGSPHNWAAFMADRSPQFKSLVAHALNKASIAAPAAGKAAVPAGIGVSASSEAEKESRYQAWKKKQMESDND